MPICHSLFPHAGPCVIETTLKLVRWRFHRSGQTAIIPVGIR